jgi:hypothetical protein
MTAYATRHLELWTRLRLHLRSERVRVMLIAIQLVYQPERRFRTKYATCRASDDTHTCHHVIITRLPGIRDLRQCRRRKARACWCRHEATRVVARIGPHARPCGDASAPLGHALGGHQLAFRTSHTHLPARLMLVRVDDTIRPRPGCSTAVP